jgi:hypothetical protein
MFDLNGSDTDWLVYADYLEDQGIDATHIREGVTEEYIPWHFTIITNTAIVGTRSSLYWYLTGNVGGFSHHVGHIDSGPGSGLYGRVGAECHGVGSCKT